MSADEKDDGSPQDKKAPPPTRQVVVTHYGKKKKPPEDIPAEILPHDSTHIVSSPVGPVEAGSQPPRMADAPSAKESIHIPEAIFPKTASDTASLGASVSASASYTKPSMEEEGGEPPMREDGEGKSSGGGVLFLLNLLTLCALVGLAFYTYATHRQMNELEQKTQEDQTSLQVLAEQAKQSFAQADEIRNRHNTEIQTLQNFKGELENAQSRLVNLSGNVDWVLAQANYLAFMANERLKTAHDMTTALAQLNAADEQLKKLGNPAFMWVREALAKDIAKLRAFPAVNRQALWEQLSLLSTDLTRLHYKSIRNNVPSSNMAPPAGKNVSWRQGLAHSWQELKSLIRITRVQENAIPLALSEEEQSQILRTLQLICEQAQWAVLQGETKIYSRSLQSLQSGVQRYFADDGVKQHILEEIKQLEQQQIEMALPDISDSLHALSQAMIEVTKKAPASPLPPKGGSQ